MFALIESARAVPLREGWAARGWSFALHSALVATVLIATGQTTRVRPEERPVVDLVWELPPRPPAPVTALPSAPGLPGVNVPAPPTIIATETPPPGPVSIEPAPFLPGPIVAPAPGPPVGLPGPVLEERYVQERPVLLRHPSLRYPEPLRQAGIEGAVLLEAVLDTAGAVEPGSLRVLRGAHALFDAEATALIAASRYRPARVNGRAVRVRVQVPVTFALRR